MENNNKSKKKVTILIIIALILAVTAIALKVTDSNEVPTTGHSIDTRAGQVGVTINPNPVEDKLAETDLETQS